MAPADAAGLNLHRGSHGKPVRLLESRLHRLGLLASSAVDGRYRAATVNSVKRFQRQHHVRVTGRVNKSVWNMIAREVNRRIQAARGPAPSIIGHRGGGPPGLAENTLASLRYAHGWADVLEFDLRAHRRPRDRADARRDPEPDHQLHGRAGVVDAGRPARASAGSDGQPIPTFAEVAAYAATVREPIAPELKNQDFSEADIAKVVDLLDQRTTSPTGPSCSLHSPAVLAAACTTSRPAPETVPASPGAAVGARRSGAPDRPDRVDLASSHGARTGGAHRRNGAEGLGLHGAEPGPVWRRPAPLRVNAVVTDIPRQGAGELPLPLAWLRGT